MKKLFLIAALMVPLSACMNTQSSNPAGERQADTTRSNMDSADRAVGFPRIKNYTQKKLLKNAYEDMDTTVLTYAYTQGFDGKMICLGQAIGYGVSMGTQFTAPTYPQYIWLKNTGGGAGTGNIYDQAQPEPNGLYMPNSGDATIVDMIDPKTGHAHTGLFEIKITTLPFELPDAAVSVKCGEDIDPAKVVDDKEVGVHQQR